MISVTDYAFGIDYKEEFRFPDEKVNSLSVSVDNGRLGICINGEQVFYSYSLHDGCVEITKD